MSFAEILEAWPAPRIAELIESCGPAAVEKALGSEVRGVRDLAALLSPAARGRLEAMAAKAHRISRRHFGRTIGLYAPLYLSNLCTSTCAYCWFSAAGGRRQRRITLGAEQIRAECRVLAERGLRQVLLVAGEAPGVVTIPYLEEAVAIAREHLPAVSIEVEALGIADYRRLCERGIEGATLYMETYDREVYARVHQRGGKADFRRRLDALEEAGRAGVRNLNVGALLGLSAWRLESFRLALHARYLAQACWQSAISISLPRLRHVPEGFRVPAPVEDADLVQILLALRLFLPEAGFVLSTRERAGFRDHLLPLGITRMSAGSSTRPGGYSITGEETLSQFDIEDRRSPAEVAAAIRDAGYDPVWKDFDQAFIGSPGCA